MPQKAHLQNASYMSYCLQTGFYFPVVRMKYHIPRIHAQLNDQRSRSQGQHIVYENERE